MDVQSIAQQARAESIKVLVRVRPLSGTELADGNDSVAEIHSGQSLSVTSGDGKKSFRCAYDAVLGPSSSQLEVYDAVKGCTESVIDGFNSTIFAYGQTGSGKVIPIVARRLCGGCALYGFLSVLVCGYADIFYVWPSEFYLA
jgi:hypothetical protein